MKGIPMNALPIYKKVNNLEVISKLMNSICSKYDCHVSYNEKLGTVVFDGDDAYKPVIAEETMNLFKKAS